LWLKFWLQKPILTSLTTLIPRTIRDGGRTHNRRWAEWHHNGPPIGQTRLLGRVGGGQRGCWPWCQLCKRCDAGAFTDHAMEFARDITHAFEVNRDTKFRSADQAESYTFLVQMGPTLSQELKAAFARTPYASIT
jgi:hypothetical protein